MSRYILLSLLLAVRLAAQVSPGMSESDLLALKGTPSGKISIGSRVLYKWPDMSVTVVNGAVSKVSQAQVTAEASEAPVLEDQSASTPGQFSGNFRTHWQDESQYVVENTAADIVEMYVFAKTGRPPAPDRLSVAAAEDGAAGYKMDVALGSGPPVEATLLIRGNLFAPDTYRPLTVALAGRLGPLNPSDGGGTAGLLEGLTEMRADTIEAANLNVSTELTRNFSSATAHEQAALVLGAFSLREHSGKFYQVLAELCRMSAHLAFAESLRGGAEPTIDGKVADAAMLCLLNNRADSQTLLLGLPDAEAGVSEWRRALGIRNTGDYRSYQAPGTAKATLFERFERFRARLGELEEKEAFTEVAALSDEQRRLPDWGRIATCGTYGVGVGNALLASTLPTEMAEIGSTYELVWNKKATSETLVTDLNAQPTHCVTLDANGTAHVNVIGWGLWAGFFQRHLCNAIVSDFVFLNAALAVPEQAAEFRKRMDQTFWGLELYPFVRRLDATAEQYYRSAQDSEMAIIRSTPQVVPAEAWNYVSYDPGFCPRYFPPPHPFINEWHKRNPPPGTAYNIFPRFAHPSLIHQPDTIAHFEQLHAIAPWDVLITQAMLKEKYGAHPDAALVVEAYKDVSGFDPSACYQIALAYKATPDKYAEWLARAAAINPRYSYDLAKFLKAQGRDAEAVVAYENAFDNDDDPVRVSDNCLWLVKYYEKHGRSSDATKLADKAAAAYSSTGLQTKAELLELRHDYKGAFEIYGVVSDRYNDLGPMLQFLRRVQKEAPDPYFDSQLKSISEQAVSGGIVEVNLDSFAGPPADGMLISVESDETRRAGLHMGDVVVAVAGYRVRDFRSYKVLRGMSSDPQLDLIIWRSGAYMTLTASPPNKRFGVDFADYHAR
jgi:tetratricopeptide (TPR) repeat protein